jgi:hypothetical protein
MTQIPITNWPAKALRYALGIAIILQVGNIYAQSVQFTRVSDNVQGNAVTATTKEMARYERFLSAVFPTRPMKRFSHESGAPATRRVAYSIVEQRGRKFIVAAYTARWHQAINVLGIYRISAGPIQVWRSSPWEATFYDLHISTADIGPRTLVLFREGGEANDFGLGSVFSFRDGRQGFYLDDVTPSSSIVRVTTRFPFRPIFAQGIKLQLEDDGKPFVLLTAADQQYLLAGSSPVRPSIHWRFDRYRNRFESIKPASSWRPEVTTLVRPDR